MNRQIPDVVETSDFEQARGKNHFLCHSLEDRSCPFRDAQLAEQTLKKHGAKVKLVSYNGGHGWAPNTFYCDRIKKGVQWLKDLSSKPGGPAGGSPFAQR